MVSKTYCVIALRVWVIWKLLLLHTVVNVRVFAWTWLWIKTCERSSIIVSSKETSLFPFSLIPSSSLVTCVHVLQFSSDCFCFNFGDHINSCPSLWHCQLVPRPFILSFIQTHDLRQAYKFQMGQIHKIVSVDAFSAHVLTLVLFTRLLVQFCF